MQQHVRGISVDAANSMRSASDVNRRHAIGDVLRFPALALPHGFRRCWPSLATGLGRTADSSYPSPFQRSRSRCILAI